MKKGWIVLWAEGAVSNKAVKSLLAVKDKVENSRRRD